MSEKIVSSEIIWNNTELEPPAPILPLPKTIEVIDHHSLAGKQRIEFIQHILSTINEQRKLLSRNYDTADPTIGFVTAQEEALTTYANYEQIMQFLSQFPEEQRVGILTEAIASKLVATIQQSPLAKEVLVTKEEVIAVLRKSNITSELVTLMHELQRHGSTAAIIEQESCYLWQPETLKLVKSISPELYKWMRWSRFIGLIPFSLLEQLSNERIAVMGTSAAFPTIELLVSLGAGTGKKGWVRLVDDGIAKPSFTAKAVGEGSSVFNIGRDKVELLLSTLESTQPFGNFEAYSARVAFDDRAQVSKNLPIYSFIEGSTTVIETVDAPQAKLSINQVLLNKLGVENSKLFRLADTGLDPVLSYEPDNSENLQFMFGRELTSPEKAFFDFFLSLPTEQQAQLTPVAHAAIAAEFISCSPQHFLAFLANPGFLSQTATTSRFTGVVAALKMLEVIDQFSQGEVTQASVTRARNLPTHFGENFSEDELLTLNKVFSILTNGVSNPQFVQS